jgi:hypothetical protein
MTFIQHGAARGARIPPSREFRARRGQAELAGRVPGEARITREGAWRFGGLVGAIAYSLMCWTLLYHGGRAMMAWSSSAGREAVAAEPSLARAQDAGVAAKVQPEANTTAN